MDMISQLSDALLLRILTELPTAEDVVATMVLSKRWLPLWKSVPNLVFNDDSSLDTVRFSRFVDRCLILHKAPIETLHFVLTQSPAVADIGTWIEMAVQRHVHDLSIDIDCTSSTTPILLPKSLYAGCGMLVTLKLKSVTLVDSSSLPSFSTLKTLFLSSVKYPGEEFVKRLLSNCHVLEDLLVEQCLDDNATIFIVRVPSLRYMHICINYRTDIDDKGGFVIDAPSLEMLDVYNISGGFCIIENDMPNIVNANICVTHCPWGILSAITSVKSLNLCIPYSKDAYPVGNIFPRLVVLKISTAEKEWPNLLMCLLRDSPSLKALKLQFCCVRDQEYRYCWNEPSSVPECLLSGLETFEWLDYEGTEEQKEVAEYILRSVSCLKTVKISSKIFDSDLFRL